MMKKYFTILMISVFVVIGGMAKAQLVKQKAKVEEKKQSDRDWVNSSFEKDGVYGACVNDAYEFLKGKKSKSKTDSCAYWNRRGPRTRGIKSKCMEESKRKTGRKG